MSLKVLTHQSSFNISRKIRCVLAMGLVASLLAVTYPQPINTVDIIRPMQENKRAIAQKRFEEGEALRAQGAAESLRRAIAKYEEALLLWRANQLAAKPDDSVAGLLKQRILKQLAETRDDLSIARLPFTRQEAEQILALVPAGERMQALDFAASRATALSEQLSQYRYVHFATHGLADSERAELSTILLSLFDEQGKPQEGFLRAHEVYNLNLPAELVVLSACETGLGKQVKGEGLVSLTRGFMYAGAARVVVSLWSVNDRATAELMTKFYRKMLLEGQRPAAALRAAQIEMWQAQRWTAPYYWAAFTLQGEWR